MSRYDYSVGDYTAMNIKEKIEFLHLVHQNKISLWDENGNDNDIWNDYHAVQDELLHHPEQFELEDILRIMRNLDDDCFEITWQFHLAQMIFRGIMCQGENGIDFFLKNLREVPEKGRFHGWHFPIQWLLEEESYPILKEVLHKQTPKTKEIIMQILDGIEIYQKEKEELIELLNS